MIRGICINILYYTLNNIWYCIISVIIYLNYTRKERFFAEVSKNLAGYRFENNFFGLSK